MTEPGLAVLVPTPCEWCSTGAYRRKTAEVVTATTVGGATARLCGGCADAIGAGPRTPIVPVADTLPLLAAADAASYLAGQEWTTARTVPEYPARIPVALPLHRPADPPAGGPVDQADRRAPPVGSGRRPGRWEAGVVPLLDSRGLRALDPAKPGRPDPEPQSGRVMVVRLLLRYNCPR